VHALIAEEPPGSAPTYYPRPPYRPPPTWGEPPRYDRAADDDLRAADGSDDAPRAWREVDGAEATSARSEDSGGQGRSRFYHALALGCQAAAWWLRRPVSRAAALAALGVGLLASAAAFLAGMGLADAALHLMNLADAVRSGRQALSAWP
jgi:hypothetical protein